MMTRRANASADLVGPRIGEAVAGTFVLLPTLLALVRPDMGLAMLYTACPRLVSKAGSRE